jgi:hypothetical protein
MSRDKTLEHLKKYLNRRFRKHVAANAPDIMLSLTRAKPGSSLTINFKVEFDANSVEFIQDLIGIKRRKIP